MRKMNFRMLDDLRHKGRSTGASSVLSLTIVLSFLALSFLSGCSDGDNPQSPKQVVIKLFGAMERNDKAAVANSLDLAALIKTRDRDYALNLDTPRAMRTPTDILEDLTGDGQTKTVWFSLQRVVGFEEVSGDSALVEVSFVNKDTGVQYYNKFGMHRIGERWRIYSFKTAIDEK